jgi:hypothetical protein
MGMYDYLPDWLQGALQGNQPAQPQTPNPNDPGGWQAATSTQSEPFSALKHNLLQTPQGQQQVGSALDTLKKAFGTAPQQLNLPQVNQPQAQAPGVVQVSNGQPQQQAQQGQYAPQQGAFRPLGY